MSARPGGSSFGKPDHTGRSSGKLTGKRLKKLLGPPADQPWCWLPRELIASPAWQARSITLVRIINALLADHMSHAGQENGNLMATYDQLVASGAARRLICDAIAEGVFFGLIRAKPGGRWVDSNQPSTYRLTWLYCLPTDTPATNDWKRVTKEDIKKWREGRRLRATEKQNRSSRSGTTVVPLRALRNRKRRNAKT